ncbi:MAG TPA: LPS assembly lipoprotein LptE [Alicycliphilus sp.]|nr:LPS assembly lipoprotein LptE [Alicycliphilus sp.]
MLRPAGVESGGFHLRGAPQFSFRTLYVQAPPGSTLARDLVRTLQGSASNLTVLTDPAQLPQAEAVLELAGEQQERVAVGMSVAGQIRELQLRLRIRFRLRGQQGQEWIPSTELLQQRDISYNETQALSKEGEEAMLFRNMRTDLVQQLIRRLAAVKTQ